MNCQHHHCDPSCCPDAFCDKIATLKLTNKFSICCFCNDCSLLYLDDDEDDEDYKFKVEKMKQYQQIYLVTTAEPDQEIFGAFSSAEKANEWIEHYRITHPTREAIFRSGLISLDPEPGTI